MAQTSGRRGFGIEPITETGGVLWLMIDRVLINSADSFASGESSPGSHFRNTANLVPLRNFGVTITETEWLCPVPNTCV
jgi:hypothetical protein